jgi:hypothetical protein
MVGEVLIAFAGLQTVRLSGVRCAALGVGGGAGGR